MPVSSLYLFCRHVDTIADKRILEVGQDQALAELNCTRENLHETLVGHPPDELLWIRLGDVHAAFSLDTKPLHQLIEGAKWDIEARPICNEQDLIHYSNLVGGCVGAMMLNLLVVETSVQEDLEPVARKLGIAMQITNILRDVGDDWKILNRSYLPEDLCQEYDVSVPKLMARSLPRIPPPEYRALMEHLMKRAEIRYEESLSAISGLPWRMRYGIRGAAIMYREIMNEVRANKYDNLHQRAYVSLPRKIVVLLRNDYAKRKNQLLTSSVPAS